MTALARLAAATLALALPVGAAALEPRYDHRDQRDLLLALETWRESVAISAKPTVAEVRPRLRVGWGFDLSGEGDELILGGAIRLGDWRDAESQRYLVGLDARYRGYFGTEELKTFFEVGLWSELRSRLAVGPQVGLGMSYDPSRTWGAFVSLHFATAIGDARIASMGGSVGVQLRYE
jgi:hypothetical protein